MSPSAIQEQIAHVNEKQRRGPSRFADAAQAEEDLIKCYRRIEAQFRQLQVGVHWL